MKYIGSKNRIAKYLVPIIQKYIDENNITTYIEPFVGGANIIDKIKCKDRYGYDIDFIPITLLKETPNNPILLNKLPQILTKEEYWEVKRNKKNYDDWYYSAIILFGSFNSKIYGGCYGGMAKTKYGKIRNYFQESINNFRQQLGKLKNINFEIKDYKDLECENCLIYCDPPYNNCIGYCSKFNSEDFWAWTREMSKHNIVLISEYNAPSDFECVFEIPINTQFVNRSGKPIEKLFIHKSLINKIKIGE